MLFIEFRLRGNKRRGNINLEQRDSTAFLTYFVRHGKKDLPVHPGLVIS